MSLSMVDIIRVCYQILCLYCEAILKFFLPPSRRDVSGQTVLITGGGGGIGRELALEFGRLGTIVILLDIKKDDMERTADDLKNNGVEVFTYVCDVSKAEDIRRTAEEVVTDVGGVNILVNNAGILNGGAVLDMSEQDIRRTFDVNILAQFWTVRSFLPLMIKRRYGHIVNIASASAKSGTAFLVDYSSSKTAVYTFSEGLAEELYTLGHTGIQVTVVSPGFVNTSLCRNPKDRFNRLLTPKETALAAVDGMLRGEFHVIVPKSLWFGLKFAEFLPATAQMRLKTSLNLGIDPQYSPSS